MQAAVLAQYVSSLAPDRVVLGDFNSVSWGGLQKAFRAATGLDNRGTFAPTWTTRLPALLRIPIDQIFTSGTIEARFFRAGPDVGSDHRPVTAAIGLRGE
jgi:endonuclease/exonuclease/phosphatase (EEP) superfamily protein YafD